VGKRKQRDYVGKNDAGRTGRFGRQEAGSLNDMERKRPPKKRKHLRERNPRGVGGFVNDREWW